MGGTVAESHKLQQFCCPSVCFFLRSSGNECGYHDVLDGGKFRQQLVELEDEADVAVAEVGQFLLGELCGVDTIDTNRTAVGAVEGADNL